LTEFDMKSLESYFPGWHDSPANAR
jgi:hypothetical protein